MIASNPRSRNGKKAKKKPIAFAATIAAEVKKDSGGLRIIPAAARLKCLPDNTEVELSVAPGPRELSQYLAMWEWERW
jgi:hypothetical protein